MADNNREQKSTDKPEEWSLTKKKVQFVDSSSKFSLSPSFGKKQPWIVRALEWGWVTSFNFFVDVFLATKVIIKEIM